MASLPRTTRILGDNARDAHPWRRLPACAAFGTLHRHLPVWPDLPHRAKPTHGEGVSAGTARAAEGEGREGGLILNQRPRYCVRGEEVCHAATRTRTVLASD